MNYDNIVLLEDFNAVMDTKLDKTSRKKGGKLPKIFFDLLYQEQLHDIWKLKNNEVRDYTFYSASNKMCSRIDMIFVNTAITPLVKKAEILPKILSDHNPVECVFRFKAKMFRWKLNEELLNKTENLEYLKEEIKTFFEYNWNVDIANNVVWDTFKAYIRGVFISLGARERKINERKMQELQMKIKEKEIKVQKAGIKKRN